MALFVAEPRGQVWWEVLLVALLFEALFRVFGVVLARLVQVPGFALDATRHAKLARDGPSYLGSWCHATVVAGRACGHLASLATAPAAIMFEQGAWPPADAYAAAAAAIEPTNTIFLAFLVYDLAHVVAAFPRLGGADTVVHHVLFAYCSVVCGHHRVLALPFAWLAVGELSTLPLNLRWLLVQTGRGATTAMSATNWSFAVMFFLCRVVTYGLGLAHMFYHWGDLAPLLDRAPLLWPVIVLLAAGYCLNLVWFKKIVDMARGKGRDAAGRKKE